MTAIRPTAFPKKLHVLLALGFLVVMLVEWGSHSLAFVHGEPVAGMVSIETASTEHEDPCRTMTCCERREDGRSVPNFSHHLMPYDSRFLVAELDPSFNPTYVVPPPMREDVDRISRPKDPLLHPPEFS